MISIPFLTIVGPTASGKSALAMRVAHDCNGAIIAADSQTIYQYFDIGTAKPSTRDQQTIPHYGIDIIEPNKDYSAYDFQQYVYEVLKQIDAKGLLPILVGGSGLYIDAVLFDYKFRSKVEAGEYYKQTQSELEKLAHERYPDLVEEIDTKNKRRLIQLLSRGPVDSSDRSKLKAKSYIVGINPGLAQLKTNIVNRVDEMIENGFVEEVESLIKRFGLACPQLRIIGYRHITDYLNGEISLDEAKARFVLDDLSLAKRQITWFKRNPNIDWVENRDEGYKRITKYLKGKLQ